MSSPPFRRTRRGTLVVELLIALPLVGVLLGVAAALFVHASRTVHRATERTEARRALHHALRALAADLERIAPRDVLTAADSGLVAWLTIGDGIVCARAPGAFIMLRRARGDARDPLTAGALDVATADDRAAWHAASHSWLAADDTAPAGVDTASIVSAASATCPPPFDGAASRASRIELTAAAELPPLGGRVLLQRRVAWRHYVGAGGWMLGRREARPGGGWETTQPVAGPLASSAERGFVLRPLGRGMHMIALKTPRRANGTQDSTRATLAARGGP